MQYTNDKIIDIGADGASAQNGRVEAPVVSYSNADIVNMLKNTVVTTVELRKMDVDSINSTSNQIGAGRRPV